MIPLTRSISDITIVDRQRQDMGDLSTLAASIKQYGLIQPIVLNLQGQLVAGGRRLAAAKLLGWSTIPVVFKETLSQDQLHEMELEENVRRKEMTWQEKCKTIYTIHQLKELRSETGWGVKETGELLGISEGKVSYNNKVARELIRRPATDGLHKCDTLNGAIQYLMREVEDQLNLALAQKTAPPPTPFKQASTLALPNLDLPNAAPAAGMLPEVVPSTPHVYHTSNMVHMADCVTFLPEYFGAGTLPCIVTDPPYGIDMENLAPDGAGMSNIDQVEEEHDVEKNLILFTRMFQPFYTVLRDPGWCLVWCDLVNFEFIRLQAENAGFKTQRWPLIWHKTYPNKNQAPQFNTTKNYESVLVCRKGPATLPQPVTSSVFSYGMDDLKEELGGHAFSKPFGVWKYLFDTFVPNVNCILDPFAGRGSCVISALRAGKHAYGVEKDPLHFAYLQNAIQAHYRKLDPNASFI